jgi:puromycin-sensitive aminopeptidase
MCKYHNGMPAVSTNPYRLGKNVIPHHYQVHWEPDLEKGTFEGESNIAVNVVEPTDEIVLNGMTLEGPDGKQEPVLEVGTVTVTRANGTSFSGIIFPDAKKQQVRIKVNGKIGTGFWNIKATYRGPLNKKMKGLYASSYEDDAGVEHRIATTQFEAIEARRAMLCFDEPCFKAPWQLSMTVDEKLNTVSNGHLLSSTSLGNGKKRVEFAETPPLPTYLYAAMVGNLVATKSVWVDGIEVRVWCRPGKEHQAKFALKMAAFALRYFKKKYNRAYPFAKLDLLAIPDFAAGAMENAACITFREDAVLVDEATASLAALEEVAHTVAHELAHMWFGDLVTMDYWEGLWLNEAFATLMQHMCVDAWKKAWNTWIKFGLERGEAFTTDALKSTRPVEYEVIAPADADGMFDIITYSKGCSVLRMLMMYMGEDTFFKGVALYINRHAWGNTTGADLWAALSEASGMPVAEIMHSWVYTPGFPVVTVDMQDDSGAVTFKQEQFKFLADGVNKEQTWQIPLMLRAKTAEGIIYKKHLLTSKEETVYLGEDLEWVVVNADGHGFYRVLYSEALRNRLTAKPMETLSVIERFNVVDDEWACVRAGLSDSMAFISLVKTMREDDDPTVWSAMTSPLTRMKSLLPAGKRAKFAASVRELVAPVVERIGWEPKEGESSLQGELRGKLIAVLALTGDDKAAQDKAEELFKAWKQDRKAVHSDMVASVISIVAANGDDADFQDFYQLLKASPNPEEEGHFRRALSSFHDAELLKRTLDLCVNPEEIRQQDSPGMLARILQSEHAGEYAWQYAKDNWDKLNAIYSNAGMIRLCDGIPSLATAKLEEDVHAWMADHPIEGLSQWTDQLLEEQRINRLMNERETPVLEREFLQAA